MLCRFFGAELSFLSYRTSIQTEPFELEHITINQMKYNWKYSLQNV